MPVELLEAAAAAAGDSCEMIAEHALTGSATTVRRPPVDYTFDDAIEIVRNLFPSKDARPANRAVRGTRMVLAWLLTHPGDTWQQRWDSSGADRGKGWIADLANAGEGPSPRTARDAILAAVHRMLIGRVILPSYTFLAAFHGYELYPQTRRAVSPEAFSRIERAANELKIRGNQRADSLLIITKVVLCTGKGVEAITADDLDDYWAWRVRRGDTRGAPMRAVWELMRRVGDIPDDRCFEPRRLGRKTIEELVDQYGIKNPRIRELLIRYLAERRPGVDYGTLNSLAYALCGVFWADIEQHHPDQDSLALSRDDAAAWRERASFQKKDPSKPRQDVSQIFGAVRGLYRDLNEWAQEEPYWVEWVAPCPVGQRDGAGAAKVKLQAVARMHQRVRDRLPHLPRLAEIANQHRLEQAELLAAVESATVGDTFVHDTVAYRKLTRSGSEKDPLRCPPPRGLVEVLDTGQYVDVEYTEDEAFWSWAIIETFRHTGVRIEELSELTSLALISYVVPATGEVVPMLQIVPSKSNAERLLLVTPELAAVLATIISRLRRQNDGVVPLVSRYDPHEKITGPPLPHLFQRRRNWRSRCMSNANITKLINDTVGRAGLVDAAGDPLRFQAHDFRRLFTTDVVISGLPVHIAAKILGHRNLATTQHYLAVFPEDIVTGYRAFVAGRRAQRPEAEYREPTAEEWQQFHQHFELRKVALGICGRAFGSGCQHEHACIRCSLLQVDRRQIPRLVEIVKNLEDRLAEAEMHGWGGEIAGLKTSLEHGRSKLAAARRAAEAPRADLVDLGVPRIRIEQGG